MKEDAVENFKETIAKNYKEQTGLDCEFYIADASEGARRL